MQLRFVPLIVRNQDEALHFYIGRLGFHPQADLMMGPSMRFLTVSAPDGIAGVQLILSLASVQEEVAAQRALYRGHPRHRDQHRGCRWRVRTAEHSGRRVHPAAQGSRGDRLGDLR